MARRHISFLLRCWNLGGDSERVEIVHIQSGARTVVGSLEAAIVWLRADTNFRLALDGPVAPEACGGSIPRMCSTET
jgi:hypothetical protein